MKRFFSLIIVLVVTIGIGTLLYVTLDDDYVLAEEFHNFPIPNDANLESENEKTISLRWDPSKGTGVPIKYRLMIKKSGWKQTGKEGANIMYNKNGNSINLSFSTDYIEISKN